MAEELERIEELLLSEIYAALVEMSLAEKQDKLQVVTRLSAACKKLHDLIIHSTISGSVK